MRHQKAGRKFGRPAAQRIALTRNLVTALFEHGRIETTEARAKELRRWAERLITTSKANDLQARRQVAKTITKREVAVKCFTTYAPRYQDRPGGYTRIIPHRIRPGDGAPLVLVELVE